MKSKIVLDGDIPDCSQTSSSPECKTPEEIRRLTTECKTHLEELKQDSYDLAKDFLQNFTTQAMITYALVDISKCAESGSVERQAQLVQLLQTLRIPRDHLLGDDVITSFHKQVEERFSQEIEKVLNVWIKS